MERPCIAALCRHCRPGRPCAATARWLDQLDYDDTLPSGEWEPREVTLSGLPPATYVDRFGVRQDADPAGGRWGWPT